MWKTRNETELAPYLARMKVFTMIQLVCYLALGITVAKAVNIIDTATEFTFSNPRLSFDILKSNGYIQNIHFHNTSLLGPVSGNAGQTYTDFPSNAFSLTATPSYQIVNGSDWAGVIFTDNDTTVSSLVQRSWFLRDGENGLHSFVRLAYYNKTSSPGSLGESRTMFRPNNAASPWTYLITDEEQWAPLPSAEALADEVEVQDATWAFNATPNDAYFQQESEYFTKYTFASNQMNKAHGLYGTAFDGSKLGAWWVVNQKDTFYGGPLHVDLMVDGIAYNKQSTNHGGATSPVVQDGFDRTFGPQFLYFNQGPNSTLHELLADAQSLSDPAWNTDFYDEIAPYVAGYVPSSARGSFNARAQLPASAVNAVAILSANGYHFQDNALDSSAYQYWGSIDGDLTVNIPRVKEGTYRLTVYANGVFGDYIQDDIVVSPGKETSVEVHWSEESAGKELWRIGSPDKTSGEFANGFERDLTHPLHPAKYRIYWGAWDFPTQFPGGVNFTVGTSKEASDFNYVHWSQYGPTYTRNDTVTDINQWTINFSLENAPSAASNITFTIQLAGARTTAGNTDDNTGAYPTFPISAFVNNQTSPLSWTINANESSSCAERSAISCHLLANKFVFPGSWLREGWNNIVLALPHAAPVYVQYDALRLELQE